ncbi:MAG: hypothetical protein IPM29_25195 [Planctomycetes bacterium]|nr:hypothetical protein [Planctomycetota bacterium]
MLVALVATLAFVGLGAALSGWTFPAAPALAATAHDRADPAAGRPTGAAVPRWPEGGDATPAVARAPLSDRAGDPALRPPLRVRVAREARGPALWATALATPLRRPVATQCVDAEEITFAGLPVGPLEIAIHHADDSARFGYVARAAVGARSELTLDAVVRPLRIELVLDRDAAGGATGGADQTAGGSPIRIELRRTDDPRWRLPGASERLRPSPWPAGATQLAWQIEALGPGAYELIVDGFEPRAGERVTIDPRTDGVLVVRGHPD